MLFAQLESTCARRYRRSLLPDFLHVLSLLKRDTLPHEFCGFGRGIILMLPALSHEWASESSGSANLCDEGAVKRISQLRRISRSEEMVYVPRMQPLRGVERIQQVNLLSHLMNIIVYLHPFASKHLFVPLNPPFLLCPYVCLFPYRWRLCCVIMSNLYTGCTRYLVFCCSNASGHHWLLSFHGLSSPGGGKSRQWQVFDWSIFSLCLFFGWKKVVPVN